MIDLVDQIEGHRAIGFGMQTEHQPVAGRVFAVIVAIDKADHVGSIDAEQHRLALRRDRSARSGLDFAADREVERRRQALVGADTHQRLDRVKAQRVFIIDTVAIGNAGRVVATGRAVHGIFIDHERHRGAADEFRDVVFDRDGEGGRPLQRNGIAIGVGELNGVGEIEDRGLIVIIGRNVQVLKKVVGVFVLTLAIRN
ncbi:MAG: hypothetical protein MZV49_12425 [Rhodopseudomonas palustris]|nr:hypothetical protein [Rhodopseudomonas palustris]